MAKWNESLVCSSESKTKALQQKKQALHMHLHRKHIKATILTEPKIVPLEP